MKRLTNDEKIYEEKNLENQLRLWQMKKFYDRPSGSGGCPEKIRKRILGIIRRK